MAKKKGCGVKINWEMWRKKKVRASSGLILRKFIICSVQFSDLFWHLKNNMALEYCHLKKAKTESNFKSKQWKDDQSNVFSFCLKYEKYCRKFWNPPCLTHWPTFVSRKFPQVQLLVGEFVDPIFRRVARAHRRAHGAPRLRPSPAPRWFLISQNHHRTVRLETPASAVDQIVSYCWTFWESKIFKEYSQILQTIQNIHWF